MTRSINRGIFVDKKLYRLSKLLKVDRKKWPYIIANYLKIRTRKIIQIKETAINLYRKSAKISRKFVGYTFNVHTGMHFQRTKITKHMVGFRFGEFVITKRMGAFIHRENKIAKKKG